MREKSLGSWRRTRRVRPIIAAEGGRLKLRESPRYSANLADDAHRQREDRVQRVEDGVKRHADQPEWQQHRPDQRIDKQDQQSQRPTCKEQQAPQQEEKHGSDLVWVAFDFPTKLFAKAEAILASPGPPIRLYDLSGGGDDGPASHGPTSFGPAADTIAEQR